MAPAPEEELVFCSGVAFRQPKVYCEIRSRLPICVLWTQWRKAGSFDQCLLLSTQQVVHLGSSFSLRISRRKFR